MQDQIYVIDEGNAAEWEDSLAYVIERCDSSATPD